MSSGANNSVNFPPMFTNEVSKFKLGFSPSTNKIWFVDLPEFRADLFFSKRVHTLWDTLWINLWKNAYQSRTQVWTPATNYRFNSIEKRFCIPSTSLIVGECSFIDKLSFVYCSVFFCIPIYKSQISLLSIGEWQMAKFEYFRKHVIYLESADHGLQSKI